MFADPRAPEPAMLPLPSVIAAGRTDRGHVRARNEDAFAVDAAVGIGIVADGMGGHPGGDVASRIAVRAAADALRALLPPVVGAGARDAADPGARPDARPAAGFDPHDTEPGWEDAMRESVLRAHQAIRARGREEPALDGMGTTTTMLALDPAQRRFTLANVGDSRVYLHRDGRLEQLTRDDTWVQERVEAGRLSAAEAVGHPMGHLLTQCLGLEPEPRPRTMTGSFREGDAFLLCSDGLVACLTPDEIAQVLDATLDGTAEGAERTLAKLVDAANAVGGFDNITVVLMAAAPNGR